MEPGSERQTHSKICLACNRGYLDHIAECPNDGTTLMAFRAGDPWIGKMLADRYLVQERLGKGGIGIIYLAHDETSNLPVAIKMLQSGLVVNEVSVKRFEQEVKATSGLDHPNLVTWLDSGFTSVGQPFLVMEYLKGQSLLEVLRKESKLKAARAVHIFAQVAAALQYAHEQGMVHRDLKPSNIILIDAYGDPEFAKVVDFGLVKLMPGTGKAAQKLTKAGETFGSPIYTSPEQCTGKPIGPTSDIYSLGVALFEAVTGKPPFLGSNPVQTTSMHLYQMPPRVADVAPDADVAPALEAAISKALQKEPADRFASMSDFRDALLGTGAEVAPPSPVLDSADDIPVLEPEPPAPTLIEAVTGWFRRLQRR